MEHVNLERMKQAVEEVVAQNPDAINPRDLDGRCLYTKRADDETPNAAEHCVGGAVLLHLGAHLPNEYYDVFRTVDGVSFDDIAMHYLKGLQLKADDYNRSVDDPAVTWGQALARLKEETSIQ